MDIFKRRLENYMSTILDEPQVLAYTAQRRADSNGVLDMGTFVNAHCHHKWKCLVIHPEEEVALTALPGA